MMKTLTFLILMSILAKNLLLLTFLLMIFLLLMLTLQTHSQEIFMSCPNFYWDTLSLSLIGLSTLIVILMLMASLLNPLVQLFQKSFSMLCWALLASLILAFSASNLLYFYIFFEASLLPTFAIILGWGNQPERAQAGVYMLIYTVFASLPLLLSLLLLYQMESSLSFLSLPQVLVSSFLVKILTFTLLVAFIVKLPLFMVHLWLPKAHVEAPVAGSMILAAILLKLGGYGMIRLSKLILPALTSLGWIFMSWAMVGGALIAVICILQNDIKFLIALSSVAHMSLMAGGVLTLSYWGLNGAQLIIIGHGFCSSGLFCIANLAYERTSTRSLSLIKGLQAITPALTLWWFLLCTSNMAAPPSLNLLGELQTIMATYLFSFWSSLPIAVMVFMAASYSLYLYSQTQHGKPSGLTLSTKPATLREQLLLALHWIPLNILIMAPWVIQISV